MAESSINTKIQKAIAEIAPIANHLPGVVILHDLRDWTIAWMSERGLQQLDISLEKMITLSSEEYYQRYFNEDDAKDYVPKILEIIKSNDDNDLCTCFQQVRFSINGDWIWHMTSTKVFVRDDQGKAIIAISMAFPIDTMHHMTSKATRLLEENNFLRRNQQLFSNLSKREREILGSMALGKSSSDTAEELFISQFTVKTHIKNIKKKLDTNSYYDLCQYARAFDLI